MSAVDVELPVDGLAAPPRANGELVFAEPWESRAFGLALSLHQAKVFPWEDFQAALIAAIREDDRTRPREPAGSGGKAETPYSYYRCWLTALETVLADLGLVDAEQVRQRVAEQLARPAGHDHGHEHGHEHGDHGHSHG